MNEPRAKGPCHECFPDVAEVAVSRRRLKRRVAELGREITDHYAGGELTVVAVLAGGMVFLADLIRHVRLPLRLEMVSIRSYPGKATRSQGPEITLPLEADLEGKDVLLVDDILDSGRTLGCLAEQALARRARSVRLCVLLRKGDVGGRTVAADFVGFDVGPEFLVGYGLDFDGLYRNLPDICVLKPHVLPRAVRPQAARRQEGAAGVSRGASP